MTELRSLATGFDEPVHSIDPALLALIYDVAEGVADWSQLAASLSRAVGGDTVSLFLLDRHSRGVEFLASSGPCTAAQTHAYVETLFTRNQLSNDSLLSPSRFDKRPTRSAASRDAATISEAIPILRQRVWYCDGIPLEHPGDRLFCLGCQGSNGENGLTARFGTRLHALLPHLKRAAQIHRRLNKVVGKTHDADAILDNLPFGLIHLDLNGAVVHANARARLIADRRDGLIMTPRGVHAQVAADEARLQKLIAGALSLGGFGATNSHASIKRPETVRPYSVLVTPMPHGSLKSNDRPACLLFVTDPDDQLPPSPQSLCDVFGLTAAEARVVSSLAMGISLPKTAADLGVTINTARTLLSRAMARTDTNSQIALVRMVLTTLMPISANS